MQHRFFVFTVFCITFFLHTLFAQTGSIEGIVVKPENLGLSDAQIEIVELNIGGFSHTDGKYRIENVPVGKYALRITHVGFKPQIIENIVVSENRKTKISTVVLQYDPTMLSETIVTATQTEKKINELPNAVNVISELAIRQRNAKTSAEALREESGVFVQKTNHGGGSAIIRGLSSNQILLKIDGIRLNNSTYRLGNHQYLTTVDQNSLDRIEVVRGPNSVLHGSDALGGTINLVTRRPQLNSGNSIAYNAAIFGRHATADDEFVGRAEAAVYNEKAAFLLGYSYKNFGDLRRGASSDNPELENSTNGLLQSPTGFNAEDGDAKLFFQLSNSSELLFAYQASRQYEVPRYDKYESGDNYKWLYDPQRRNLAYVRFKSKTDQPWMRNLQFTLSAHQQIEGRITQSNVNSDTEVEKDDVRTLGMQFSANTSIERHVITYGAELYRDGVRSRAETRIFSTNEVINAERGRFPDTSTYLSVGAYLQDEFYVTRDFNMIIGGRYSGFATNFNLANSQDAEVLNEIRENYEAFTGNLGLIYRPLNSFSITSFVSQAFRAPNLSDLSKLGESKGSTFEIPNADLSPEKMLSFDLSLRWENARSQFSVTGYYGKISDLLASADDTFEGSATILSGGDTLQIKSKQNIGEAYIAGTELSGQLLLPKNTRLYGNFSYTYGQNTTVDEPIGGIPPYFGTVGLQSKFERLNAAVLTRFAGKQDRLSEDDMDDPRIPTSGTPSWQIWTIRFDGNVFKNVNAQFSIENIFDKNYREHGSGINGPGRNFVFGLRLFR